MSNLIFVCDECGSPLALEVVGRWPDGRVQEAVWVCPNDPEGTYRGWYCDGGTLDLEVVRDEQDARPSVMDVTIYDV